ncbi:MAG: hypothetical protein Tsb002_23350 [Wenzhouxiangellaceae bacterium]
MNFTQGQYISIHEQGGPSGSWEYQQAMVEVLNDFNGRHEAEAFVEAEHFDPQGQSIECQFIDWLEERKLIKRCQASFGDWNITTTLIGAKGNIDCRPNA